MASGPSTPLSELTQDSPVKRRKLTYAQHDDVVYAIRELAARGGPLKDLIKPAARKWADDKSASIGSFSQPRKLPNAEPTYCTSALCGKCDGCWSNAGKVYRFEASIQQGHFLRLIVSTAGDCCGEPRVRRRSSGQNEAGEAFPGLSEQDRLRVLAACDSLLAEGVHPTPMGVTIRMGKPAVDIEKLRAVLRWRKQEYGQGAAVLKESEADFEAYVRKWEDPQGGPLHVPRWSLHVFTWTAILTPFLLALANLREAGQLHELYLAADFTFKIDIFNYSLGLVAAVIRRKLRGTWTVTPWPLAAVLSPSEDTSHYRSAFETLSGALKQHKLPQPTQVNTDFFSGSGTAAAQTFKDIVLVHDLWHMRRNLVKNDKAFLKFLLVLAGKGALLEEAVDA
ncbi:HERC1, partial [Symbiodinium necroappetens]